jgi:hypothetical protein
MTQEEKILLNVNYLLIGVKLNALKLTLSDKQLEIYSNFILDKVEPIKADLYKVLSKEKADEVMKAFLG